MRKFKDVNELVNTIKPDYPVYCIRPVSIKISTEFFKSNFPGKVLYAVKTNPTEKVLKQIIANGILHFDVASINEVKLMNAIKSTSFASLKNKEMNEPFDESVYSKDGKKINFFNLGFKNKWQNSLSKDIIEKLNKSLKKELSELNYI